MPKAGSLKILVISILVTFSTDWLGKTSRMMENCSWQRSLIFMNSSDRWSTRLGVVSKGVVSGGGTEALPRFEEELIPKNPPLFFDLCSDDDDDDEEDALSLLPSCREDEGCLKNLLATGMRRSTTLKINLFCSVDLLIVNFAENIIAEVRKKLK
jgi:hypothetical protein